MNAYDFLKLFQHQVERETGIRPQVDVKVFQQDQTLSDEQCEEFRNYLVEQSKGALEPANQTVDVNFPPFMNYRATDHKGRVEVHVYGPRKE